MSVSTVDAHPRSAAPSRPSLKGGENPHRGEASVRVGGEVLTLRPSFTALVAAEAELGSLFALVERAATGAIRLSEIVELFWHCLVARPAELTRERLGEAVAAQGLSGVMPAVTALLRQVMLGR